MKILLLLQICRKKKQDRQFKKLSALLLFINQKGLVTICGYNFRKGGAPVQDPNMAAYRRQRFDIHAA